MSIARHKYVMNYLFFHYKNHKKIWFALDILWQRVYYEIVL